MHITLFGGSFNPPHIGHQIVIDQAFELMPDVDEMWLLPDYQHNFPKNEKLVSPEHRLAMTRLLETERVKTETSVIDKKMSGNTIDHVEYLLQKYQGHNFSFLLGSDNLPTFIRWQRWGDLISLIPFYIYPRAGHQMGPLQKNMTPLLHPLQALTNISSTLVRHRLENDLSVDFLLPPRVAKYIKDNRLYLS